MKKGSTCLSKFEMKRYSRNMLIAEWRGVEGQKVLKDSKVLVVGAGGSGSALLYYLAAAGIGEIRLCDGDRVEPTNLNRQILHNERRMGVNKARSARTTLRQLNSNIKIVAYERNLDEANVEKFADGCDVICCAADNRDGGETYRVLDRYSFKKKISICFAGGIHMGGFVTMIGPPKTPCIGCMVDHYDRVVNVNLQHEGPNPIVGAAAGMAGALQALETIKFLLHIGDLPWGKMFCFQTVKGIDTYEIPLEPSRKSSCALCGVNIRAQNPLRL